MIKFKSMELDDEDKNDLAIPCGPCGTSDKKMLPAYPWGLKVTLEDAQLKKLGIDVSKFEVGGMVHLHLMCKVTDVGQSTRADGSTPCRIELQGEQAAIESEDAENEEAETKRRPRLKSVYKS